MLFQQLLLTPSKFQIWKLPIQALQTTYFLRLTFKSTSFKKSMFQTVQSLINRFSCFLFKDFTNLENSICRMLQWVTLLLDSFSFIIWLELKQRSKISHFKGYIFLTLILFKIHQLCYSNSLMWTYWLISYFKTSNFKTSASNKK